MSLDAFLDWALAHQLNDLPESDVRSCPAFHGKINRQAAEVLLVRSGQYLIRESRSGQFVLSTYFLGEHLHFIIRESSDSIGARKFFFENESFDSVAALVRHYVDSGQPVTATSQVVVTSPVARQTPIGASRFIAYYKRNAEKSLEELIANYRDDDNEECDSLSQKSLTASVASDGAPNTVFNRHLEALTKGVSAISMESNWTSEQKSEMFQAVDMNLGTLLGATDSETLAEHLFRCDLAFFGLSEDIYELNSPLDGSIKLESVLELSMLPPGKQFRRDAIVRNECLKYFVIATLLKQSNCFDAQTELLSKWIRIASKLALDYGDHFGFGAIMYGLLDPKVGRKKTLWHGLRSRARHEFQLFESCLMPKFFALLDLSSYEFTASKVSLPFVISLYHMIECNSISNNEFLPRIAGMRIERALEKESEHENNIGLVNFSLDSIMAGIVTGNVLMGQIEQFEANAQEVLSHFQSESASPPLLALFMTEFHLQFFFGSSIEINKINHRIFKTLELKL